MGGRASRRKGSGFERQIANLIKAVLPEWDPKRGYQSRYGGEEQSDVEIPYFHIECKAHKRVNIRKALTQAINDSQKIGRVPVAVTKDDNTKPVATMLFDDFLQLLLCYEYARQQQDAVHQSE